MQESQVVVVVFFWPRLPRKSGLGTNMAEKAELLWPRLPRKLGRGQACQALPGRIFPVSLAKNPESAAWPGFARLAGFLTALLMQGLALLGMLHCEYVFLTSSSPLLIFLLNLELLCQSGNSPRSLGMSQE